MYGNEARGWLHRITTIICVTIIINYYTFGHYNMCYFISIFTISSHPHLPLT